MRHANQLAFWTPDQAPVASTSGSAGGILSSIGGAISNVIGSVGNVITSQGGVDALSQYLSYRLGSRQVAAGQTPTGLPAIQTPQQPIPAPLPTTAAPGGGASAGAGFDPTLLYVGGGVLIVVLLLTAGRR